MPRGFLELNAALWSNIYAPLRQPALRLARSLASLRRARESFFVDEQGHGPEKDKNFFKTCVTEYQNGGALLQADIVAALIREGVAVHALNQRDIAGRLAMIRMVCALVGAAEKAERLAIGYEQRLEDAKWATKDGRRPRVYFEEWDDPMISGIGRVSELFGIAGDDIFRKGAPKGCERPDRFAGTGDRCTARDHSRLLVRKEGLPGEDQGRPGWAESLQSATIGSSRSRRH